MLKTEVGRAVFQTAGAYITKLLDFTYVGLVVRVRSARQSRGVAAHHDRRARRGGRQYANIFAFQVLPTIIFIAALFAMLYYFGVMQLVVRVFAVVMRRFMRASGAESLNVAASIFMGQTEAPLTIRPFLPRMTESELMTVMTAGMAHISGGVMAAYILFGVEAQHLLTAVIMTAPGTLMMAKLFVPETGEPETMGTVKLEVERTDVNVIDAVGRGTGEGLHLALNVGAMLISFLALVALVNAVLGLAGLSMQQILGWAFAPIAWSLGVPWRDAPTIGNLLGTRMVLNEFVAYSQLGPLKDDARPEVVHHRHVRALRLRQLQLDRHPDRRHRRAGARAAARPGAARACGRCSPARSPTSSPRPSRACCCERAGVRPASTRRRRPCAPAAAPLPDVAVVLGSGLGDFADSLADAVRVPYETLPHWPQSRVVGHAGRLVVGRVGGQARGGAVGPRARLRGPRRWPPWSSPSA